MKLTISKIDYVAFSYLLAQLCVIEHPTATIVPVIVGKSTLIFCNWKIQKSTGNLLLPWLPLTSSLKGIVVLESP